MDDNLTDLADLTDDELYALLLDRAVPTLRAQALVRRRFDGPDDRLAVEAALG